jgi:hypothetical protein
LKEVDLERQKRKSSGLPEKAVKLIEIHEYFVHTVDFGTDQVPVESLVITKFYISLHVIATAARDWQCQAFRFDLNRTILIREAYTAENHLNSLQIRPRYTNFDVRKGQSLSTHESNILCSP